MRWKPLGDVDQEAADELVGVECHRLPAVGAVDAVVLPTEGDAVVVGRDQTAIGDRDAMRVARQAALGAQRRDLAVEVLPGARDAGIPDFAHASLLN
jgi:hypothetical protein